MFGYSAPGVSGIGATRLVRPPDRLTHPRGHWQPLAQVAGALADGEQRLNSVDERLWQVAGPRALRMGMHPFKIYQLPSVYRTAPNDAVDWRKFRIRGGSVFLDDAIGYPVSGTDGRDLDADLPTVDEADCTDILMPAETTWSSENQTYWFWLEIDYGGSPAGWRLNVRHGYDPTEDDESSNPNAWSSWPTMDGHRIPIGCVHYPDQAALDAHWPYVRQFLRCDLMLGVEIPVCEDNVLKPHVFATVKKEAVS